MSLRLIGHDWNEIRLAFNWPLQDRSFKRGGSECLATNKLISTATTNKLRHNFDVNKSSKSRPLIHTRAIHIGSSPSSKLVVVTSALCVEQQWSSFRLAINYLYIVTFARNKQTGSMNSVSPTKDPSSPTLSRTSTQGSLLEQLQTTPKASFLSRRRGDSDGTGKSSNPFSTFSNGSSTTRPTSSPTGVGKTATVCARFTLYWPKFEELTQQLEVEEKIKAGAENLLKVSVIQSPMSWIR